MFKYLHKYKVSYFGIVIFSLLSLKLRINSMSLGRGEFGAIISRPAICYSEFVYGARVPESFSYLFLSFFFFLLRNLGNKIESVYDVC